VNFGLFRHIALAGIPRGKPEPGIDSLWEWIERHAIFVVPIVVLLMILLIAGTMTAAWRAEEMTAEQRAALKAKIMGVMRRRASGVSAELVAAELQIDLMVADKMLRQMVDEGLLGISPNLSATDPTRYRIRGAT
jgi:ABC-type phosphate transport system auxiliary subunit